MIKNIFELAKENANQFAFLLVNDPKKDNYNKKINQRFLFYYHSLLETFFNLFPSTLYFVEVPCDVHLL